MPYRAWNNASPEVKRRYFELIRRGVSGGAASSQVGVSLSCGSLRFIDAGSGPAAHPHLGSGQRAVPPHLDRTGDRAGDLLRRPTQPLAAGYQREHQRPASPVFPKGADLNVITDQRLRQVADELNNRPRFVLDDAHQHISCDDGYDHRFATTDRNRPVYAAILIDAIIVKARDGQVGNQPFYAAIGVDLEGHKDIVDISRRRTAAGRPRARRTG